MKKGIGFGNLCAGGMQPFNTGSYVRREESGVPGEPLLFCQFCGREVRRKKDGSIVQHVWQPKDESERLGANTQATRAARAFERTRGKP